MVAGGRLPPRDNLESAIRSAGYEPEAASWISRSTSTWITVAVTSLILVALVWVARSAGLVDFAADLVNPSRGGLMLARSTSPASPRASCRSHA